MPSSLGSISSSNRGLAKRSAIAKVAEEIVLMGTGMMYPGNYTGK